MTGANLIFVLQCLTASAWGVPLISKWRSIIRVWNNTARRDDLARAVIWFVAASVELGVLRWLLFPRSIYVMSNAEIYSWAGVYGLSIAAACAVSWVFRERGSVR